MVSTLNLLKDLSNLVILSSNELEGALLGGSDARGGCTSLLFKFCCVKLVFRTLGGLGDRVLNLLTGGEGVLLGEGDKLDCTLDTRIEGFSPSSKLTFLLAWER